MLVRALCALSALVSAPVSEPQVYRIPDDNRIALVDCNNSRGTAFRVGPHIYLSVAHVTDDSGCTINGKPFKVVRTEDDFAVIRTAQDEAGFLAIDCHGFIARRQYVAIGHARGLPYLTAVEITATGERAGDFQRLQGIATVIPGQSGGPILDKLTGAVVGTVNVYNGASGASGSVSLSDTSVCRA